MRRFSLTQTIFIGLAALSLSCSGGGSSGGGAPAPTTPTTPSGGTTTPTPPPSNPTPPTNPTNPGTPGTPSSVALADQVKGPNSGLGTSDITIQFNLVDNNASPTDVSIEFSTDGGATWATATPASTSAGLTALMTAAMPGVSHDFIWNSMSDLGANFFPAVLVRVTPTGGTPTMSQAFAIDNATLNTSVQVTRQPYLQSMTQTSVIIVWKTATPAASSVELGLTPGLGQNITLSGTRSDHAVQINGLQAGTTYFYRLGSPQGPLTQRFSFVTAPPSNVADFTFIAFGDSGSGSTEQMQLAQLMSQDQFDFILHTGDIIYPAGESRNYDPHFFTPYASMLSRAPIFPAIGNHDLITLGIPFEEVFFLPANNPQGTEFYYSFEYGDAKFIALDTTLFGHIPFGGHMTWLEGELTSNTRQWLIVFFHIPLYSSGTHGNDRILEFNLGPLFENNAVDLVITGHDHNYERFNRVKKFSQDPSYKGAVHLVTGGGGKDTRSVGSQSRTAYAEEAFHYTKFRVSRNQILGEAIRIDGTVIDNFIVDK